jgi:hypothetical protein
MATFTASASGMCSACFNQYFPGARLIRDDTGKVKHVFCGRANRVASALERRRPQGRRFTTR